MKNYSFLFLLFLSISLFGQVEKPTTQVEKPITKGHKLIGGDFNFEYERTTTQVAATPNFGYFIKDHLALGLNLPVQYSNYNDGFQTFTSIGVGPYLKYYFNNGLFVSVGTSGNISCVTVADYTNTSYFFPNNIRYIHSYNTNISISPGIGYACFLNKNVSLEGGVFYEHMLLNEYSNSAEREDNFKLQIGLQIFL